MLLTHPPLPTPYLARSNNVKKRVNMEQLASGLNKQKVIEKVGRLVGQGGNENGLL